RAEKKIGLWFQGQLLLVVIIAILTYLGLTLIGIEHSLLLAVLAGMFELIPLFGPILAGIPAVAIAFLTGGVTKALIVIALYLIIQQFENQLIYPLVVKKVVGVPAIIVILALIAGGTLAGFLGIILSVPIAAVLMELFVDLQKKG
ncbi:MAG: AI-2E family transporter, partial [Candidatus Pacebacteria bacterium]|nr:AI-2E family transporter [Candidatus Paceibacterota bacterium]